MSHSVIKIKYKAKKSVSIFTGFAGQRYKNNKSKLLLKVATRR